MSIELELEENGQLRVRVDTEGERAVSDVVDPIQFIHEICATSNIECLLGEGEMTILTPAVETEPEEGESAQEDDNV